MLNRKPNLITTTLLAATLVLFLPRFIGAHGRISKLVNNSVIYVYQTPLSPLVGEEVDFAIKFTDLKTQPLANKDVTLSLTDTFYGDEAKDVLVLTRDYKTDANGMIDFKYKFEKENYFDIDLAFADPVTNEKNETGFLVQPRRLQNAYQVLAEIASGIVLGLLVSRLISLRAANKQAS